MSFHDAIPESSDQHGPVGWRYGPAEMAGIVELGWWHGGAPPDLSPHFHDESLCIFVLSGARHFRIGAKPVAVRAGHAIHIPAGLMHASCSGGENATCVNAYVAEQARAPSFTIFEIRPRWVAEGRLCLGRFLEDWSGSTSYAVRPTAKAWIAHALAGSAGRIEDLAANAGWSREGFSRMARRELGVAPHAFRMLTRLNAARHMLRAGYPIAAVAAEAGFADQSHLTRLFRSAFGTTPGRYRRG